MTIKSKLTAALFATLTIAAPLALSAMPADAAPNMMARHDDNNGRGHDNAMGGSHDNNMGGGHMDVLHDHGHRPPMRAENRPRQPHGHYRWRTGAWNWHGNAWTWQPGIWIRF